MDVAIDRRQRAIRPLWLAHGWWMQRIAMLPVHLFFFAIAVFFIVRLIPGDPVYTIMGGQPVTPETLEAARKSLGLSGSIVEQFLAYLSNLLTLDLGNSLLSGEPVLDALLQRMPSTLELAMLGMAGAISLTIVGGFVVVLYPRNPISRILAQYARTAGAIPDFVLGLGLIFVFYAVLRWVPSPIGLYNSSLPRPPRVTGFPLLDTLLTGNPAVIAGVLAHLVLPIAVLVLAHAPMILKIFIRGLHDAMDAPATLFRIATGASRGVVLASIARRALPTTIAMFGTTFGFMLGGSVIVEQMFSIAGMGQFGVDAVSTSDLVALQGFLIVVAAISLTVFLAVDLLNMIVDPRRRPGQMEGRAQ